MRWRLFRLGGTTVWLHPAALVLAAYMTAVGFGNLLVVGFISILLHEGAHALMSACFGKAPEDVEITPLGALMRLEDDEALSLSKRLLVLMAGPVMTLLLCYLALFLTQAGWLPWGAGRQFFLCNAAILFVNLLPALPLDGGRLLAMGLSCLLRRETVQTVMRAIGTALGLICVVLNLWLSWSSGGWNLSLAAAGCFLMYSAARSTTTHAMAELRDFMDRKSRLESCGSMPCRWVTLSGDAQLRQAVRCLHPRRHTMFCVVRDGTADHRGFLSEQAVIAAYLDDPSRAAGELL
ncbi:MAG: hypothetical protein J1E43_07860 [Christensenellaceae bacterium]|nr:hypothetical protein [Christensenellaceae bacterium]